MNVDENNLNTVCVNNRYFDIEKTFFYHGIFNYHFENEFKTFKKRLYIALSALNSILLLITSILFYILYIKFKKIPADRIIEKQNYTVKKSLKNKFQIFTSLKKINWHSAILSFLLCIMFLFVVFHTFYDNFQNAMRYQPTGDEMLYCATAAAICNSSLSAEPQPYAFLEQYAPLVQIPLGLFIKVFGPNPIFYGIFLTLFRNIVIVLLCAFIFWGTKASFSRKCICSTLIFLVHNALPAVALWSNYSAVGFGIVLLTLSAYILFFKEESKLFISLSGLVAGLSVLARSNILHLTLMLPAAYFFIKLNITRNFKETLFRTICWLAVFLSIIIGMEIFWMLWYGLETYTNVLPLQRRSYLLSAHSIQAGIWNLSFITNNILQHYNNVLKQLGYFVYFFCGLLFFAISTIIILPYKNLKQYFPFVLIITLLPQIIMFFLFHRHSSYFYISITYLSAMLALCATLLIDYKKNNTVIACGALICCIFWSKYNPDHLMKIRNYDFKIPPANATEMVNYSIGSHFYPDAPFLVMHPNAFSRPRYRGLDNALYYTNPRMKRFKTLKEFEKLFDPNGTILTIGTEQELFMKKLPADIIYKEVERDKRYIWYYCTRKL